MNRCRKRIVPGKNATHCHSIIPVDTRDSLCYNTRKKEQKVVKMHINTHLIVEELKDEFTVTQHLPCEKATLCSFRVYDGSPLQPECLYLIRPDQLLFADTARTDVAFLCPDVGDKLDFPVQCGIITLKEHVDTGTLVNRVIRIFERFDRWNARLQAGEPSIEGIKQLFELSRPMLGGTLVLADNHFNHLTSTADFEQDIKILRKDLNGQTPDYVADEILTDPDYIRLRNCREIFEYPIHNRSGTVPALLCNLFRKDETEYSARVMYIPDDRNFTPARRFLLKHLCLRVEEIINQLSSYMLFMPYSSSLREIIANGLRRQPSSEVLVRSVLKYMQWDVADEYQLVLLKPFFLEDPKEMNAVTRTHMELVVPNSCAVVVEGCIALLVNQTLSRKQGKGKHLREILVTQLRERLYKAGVSAPFRDFGGLHKAYLEANAALTLGNSEDSMFWYYDFQDYALEFMLGRCQEGLDKTHLCIPGLIRLMEYDEKNGTEYTLALRTFVEEKYSVTHTADKLFVHRTTLLKHLKKIDEISNLDLDDWKTRLHLCLSFQFLSE